MEFNWSTIAWIAGLLFVYIFGLVEGRSKGYKKRKTEEEQEKRDAPPPAPETVTVNVDDPGLLRIKNENGAFTLDLDGARVNPTSLSADQRKRLIDLLNIMRPWLEGRPAPAPSAPAAPAPSRPVPMNEPVNRPAPLPPVPPISAQPAARQPVDTGPVRSTSPRPAIIAKEDRPVAPANSIVSQIDTVLQTRLAGTPLEERGIFLTESSEGGVAVYVGLTRYNGIDDVPDPEIKAAIRAAIAEWEDKFTPGL
ncbi:MAG TPA: hypothetical protein VK897_13715 [Anaerolineales bacterium]|nr:hypothetical protein [Anaerolineales bacterium]